MEAKRSARASAEEGVVGCAQGGEAKKVESADEGVRVTSVWGNVSRSVTGAERRKGGRIRWLERA